MSILIKEYNTLLTRWKKAYNYLNSNTPQDEKESWLLEYENICKRLNELVTDIRKQGIYPTNEQLLEGIPYS